MVLHEHFIRKMELFLCYRSCVSPSAVTLSCSAYLDGSKAEQSLVIAKGNQLEIYLPGTNIEGQERLGLRGVFPLFGNLVGLTSVTVSAGKWTGDENSIDMLLLTFSPAKVILVKYDTGRNKLIPARLFNFEAGAVGTGAGFASVPLSSNIATAAGYDSAPMCVAEGIHSFSSTKSSSRCCAVLVYGQQLFIIPLQSTDSSEITDCGPNEKALRKSMTWLVQESSKKITSQKTVEEGDDEEDGDNNDGAGEEEDIEDDILSEEEEEEEAMDETVRLTVAATIGESVAGVAAATQALDIPAAFPVDLASFGVCGLIRDMTFLAGYSHPTLLILYESNASLPLPGRASKEGSCSVVALSFHLAASAQSPWVVFSMHDIPFDACRLVACPLGGSLVLCDNSIMLLDHNQVGWTALNAFAAPLQRVGGIEGEATHMSTSMLPTNKPPASSASARFQSVLESHLDQEEPVTEERREVDESVCEVLSSAPCSFIGPLTALLATNSGRLLCLNISKEAHRQHLFGDARLSLRVVAKLPSIAASITPLRHPLKSQLMVFSGSRLGSSSLLSLKASPGIDRVFHDSSPAPTKRSRAEDDSDEEDACFYGEPLLPEQTSPLSVGDYSQSKYQTVVNVVGLSVLDVLMGTGPMNQGSLVASNSGINPNPAQYDLQACQQLDTLTSEKVLSCSDEGALLPIPSSDLQTQELVFCSGLGQSGGLCTVSDAAHGRKLDVMMNFHLTDVNPTGVFAVRTHESGALVVTSREQTRMFELQDNDGFRVLQEVRCGENQLRGDVETWALGELCSTSGASFTVQVHAQGMRLSGLGITRDISVSESLHCPPDGVVCFAAFSSCMTALIVTSKEGPSIRLLRALDKDSLLVHSLHLPPAPHLSETCPTAIAFCDGVASAALWRAFGEHGASEQVFDELTKRMTHQKLKKKRKNDTSPDDFGVEFKHKLPPDWTVLTVGMNDGSVEVVLVPPPALFLNPTQCVNSIRLVRLAAASCGPLLLCPRTPVSIAASEPSTSFPVENLSFVDNSITTTATEEDFTPNAEADLARHSDETDMFSQDLPLWLNSMSISDRANILGDILSIVDMLEQDEGDEMEDQKESTQSSKYEDTLVESACARLQLSTDRVTEALYWCRTAVSKNNGRMMISQIMSTNSEPDPQVNVGTNQDNNNTLQEERMLEEEEEDGVDKESKRPVVRDLLVSALDIHGGFVGEGCSIHKDAKLSIALTLVNDLGDCFLYTLAQQEISPSQSVRVHQVEQKWKVDDEDDESDDDEARWNEEEKLAERQLKQWDASGPHSCPPHFNRVELDLVTRTPTKKREVEHVSEVFQRPLLTRWFSSTFSYDILSLTSTPCLFTAARGSPTGSPPHSLLSISSTCSQSQPLMFVPELRKGNEVLSGGVGVVSKSALATVTLLTPPHHRNIGGPTSYSMPIKREDHPAIPGLLGARLKCLGVTTLRVVALSPKGLSPSDPLQRACATHPMLALLVRRPRQRDAGTVADLDAKLRAHQRKLAHENAIADPDSFLKYATSLKESDSFPSRRIPGFSGSTAYAYSAPSSVGHAEEFMESFEVTTDREQALACFEDTLDEVWLVNGSTWGVLERHVLQPNERATSLELACLKPQPVSGSYLTTDSKRLYLVVGTLQVGDGEEVISGGRLLMFEVDPSLEGVDLFGPSMPPAESDTGESTEESGGDAPSNVVVEKVTEKEEISDDEDYTFVGPNERSWLERSSAKRKGAKNCWLRLSCVKTIEGGVLHVAQLANHLAVALGAGSGSQAKWARLEVFSFELTNNMSADGVAVGELDSVSFFDTPRVLHLTSLAVFKSFILLSDLDLSVQLVHWREQDKSLNLIGNDPNRCGISACCPLVDTPKLSILVADDCNNLVVFDLGKGKVGGENLRRVADFHVGSPLSSFVSFPVCSQDSSERPKVGAMLGMHDGGVAAVVPVDEPTFRRLFSMQLVLVNALAHNAALNPRTFRSCRSKTIGDMVAPKRNILDGELLWKFANLDVRLQRRLSAAIGSTAALVLESLQSIDMSTAFFSTSSSLNPD